MKKRLSLVTALVMTLTVLLSFAVTAAFKAPNYEPADTTEDIGLMLANNVEYEGVIGIHTTGTFNSAWRTAVLFERDAETGAYKAKEVFPAGASGPNWTIGENQIVVEANIGNNWPELFKTATGTEWYYDSANMQQVPYKDCPNFVNEKEQAWGEILGSIQVGDLYALVGFDVNNPAIIANYAVDENYDYIKYNADYKTYSYLTPYIEGVTDTSSTVPQTETPDTGDTTLIVFAIIAVITLSGIVVVAKRR